MDQSREVVVLTSKRFMSPGTDKRFFEIIGPYTTIKVDTAYETNQLTIHDFDCNNLPMMVADVSGETSLEGTARFLEGQNSQVMFLDRGNITRYKLSNLLSSL